MGKNILKLDTSFFKEYGEKLDRLEADLKPIFTDALEQAGETITKDTIEGMKKEYLSAHGKYQSNPSETMASIIKKPKVTWHGTIGEMGVGFDFSKKGAGGYLITGTPKMKPDKQLNKIYKSKKYMNDIKQDMIDIFQDEINKKMR